MTVVCCFKVRERPVLIADLMASRTGKQDAHISIPTNRDVNIFLPEEWLRTVSGLCRKTIKIGDRFVAGGAGDIFALRIAFKEIHKTISATSVKKDTLIGCLKDLDLEGYECSIIGWIQPDGHEFPFSFSWDSLHRDEISFGGDYLIGSGFNDFKELKTNIDDAQFNKHGGENNSTSVILEALKYASYIVGNQQATGFGLDALFGGGVEITISEAGKFKYVDNILYMSWRLEHEKLYVPPNLMMHHYYAGTHLVLRAIWPPDNGTGQEKIYCVPPLYGLKNIKKRKLTRPPAPIYFASFLIGAYRYPIVAYSTFCIEDKKNKIFRLLRDKKRGIALEFHGPSLSEIFKEHVEHAKKWT